MRDANDAHVILEAVRLKILPLIKRRLTATEREQLRTGNVFVWEEAEDDGGLLRWTDGRRWCTLKFTSKFTHTNTLCFPYRSQSRMRGDYLFYEEKVETTQEEKDAKAARRYVNTHNKISYSLTIYVGYRARRVSDPSAVIPSPIRRKDRPSKPDGLTKQTYSALAYIPGSSTPRKWHVVAYFSVRFFYVLLIPLPLPHSLTPFT